MRIEILDFTTCDFLPHPGHKIPTTSHTYILHTQVTYYFFRNPTHGMDTEWRPHKTDKPCHLRIDNDLKLVKGKITPQRIEFWKNLRATESF